MEDVNHLVDYLRVSGFRGYGTGGGGAYALAAAYHFPKRRLKRASVMCGAPHPDFEVSFVSFNWKFL